mgnify:CR=1 FL=1
MHFGLPQRLANENLSRFPLFIVYSNQKKIEKIKNSKEKLTSTFGSELVCNLELTDLDLVHAIKNSTLNQVNPFLVKNTKGASGLKRILIGSNTVRVISEITPPSWSFREWPDFRTLRKKVKTGWF